MIGVDNNVYLQVIVVCKISQVLQNEEAEEQDLYKEAEKWHRVALSIIVVLIRHITTDVL